MRRVLRIFPLYYFVLALVFFVIPLLPVVSGSVLAGLRAHQAWAWLYAVNVYLSIQSDWALAYLDHFWSLAVEEHFYFVWPLRGLGCWARRPRILHGAQPASGCAGAVLLGRGRIAASRRA